ncbi:MAG: type II secretion system protein [Aquabacterium sp.]|nr:type II secretion system protein [Aquabacterium sp.]
MTTQASERTRGFTLIEMVVVVLIVSILASAAMPLAALQKRRSQEADLRQSLRLLRGALDEHKRAWDQGRIEKKANETGYPANLDVLVAGVKDVSSPREARIYFLRRLPRDPFSEQDLPASQTWGLRSYASPPDAPMPGTDVFDVYSLHEGVGLDGTAYGQW